MSEWTHRVCEACWNREFWARQIAAHRALDDPPAPCCFCRELTSAGIYVRRNPCFTPCRGEHDREIKCDS